MQLIKQENHQKDYKLYLKYKTCLSQHSGGLKIVAKSD